MSTPVIHTEGLSKSYRIGQRQRYRTLRESLTSGLSTPFRSMSGGRRPPKSERKKMIWALKDVSLQVERGEIVGVIGRNGAGKTTLLKILSRITEPTEGWARTRGRVGSLLEVGAGFHMELTGRENIFLNGSILGMKRSEIERKMGDIVAFAEVEQFMDTPVKRYSTGMYLRLAFAVAAHLEPHVLLVDEVLAVGDSAFQKKCLGRMGDVAREGRTVLFVSHNMAAIRSLCTRGVLLESGRAVFSGPIGEAIHLYNRSLETDEPEASHADVAFGGIRVNDSPTATVRSGDSFDVACKLRLGQDFPSFVVYCILMDGNGQTVVHSTVDHRDLDGMSQPGVHHLTLRFPALWLKPGAYSLHFKLLANTLAAGKVRFLSDTVMLDVEGDAGPEALIGALTPDIEWRVSHDERVSRAR